MKKRKAQLTIFIIIAILIVAIVALFFVFRNNIGIGKEKPANPEVAPVVNFVQECLDDSLENVVFQVGENGGYYLPGSAPSKVPILEIPYYIKNNKSLMPSKEKIESEISKGVSRELILCLGNFAIFPDYNITKGKLTPPNVKIEPEKVLIDVEYPLTIQKGESRFKIEKFSSEVPVRFGIVYDAVAEFVNQSIGISGLCLDCLLEFEKKYQILVDGYYFEETGDSIFIAIDKEEYFKKDEEVFKYVFAIKK